METITEFIPWLISFIAGGVVGLASSAFSFGKMVQKVGSDVINIKEDLLDIKDENEDMKKQITKNSQRVSSVERDVAVAIVSLQKDVEFIKYAVTNKKQK